MDLRDLARLFLGSKFGKQPDTVVTNRVPVYKHGFLLMKSATCMYYRLLQSIVLNHYEKGDPHAIA